MRQQTDQGTREGRWLIAGIPTAHLAALDQAGLSPAEQANNLILWVGDHQFDYSLPLRIGVQTASEVAASCGAPVAGNDASIVNWLIGSLPESLIERDFYLGAAGCDVSLTLAGWERYEALKRTVSESRRGFLAMKFGDAELNRVVAECFKPAVEAAGFELATALENQPAGLIDDQMRVAIRTSRFVVSDLSHGNSGAYWEAGFAEGLGRPVIYTCRKAEWEVQRSHFDTNHLVTVVWDPNNLSDAASRLTATIRATLPTEAKMP